MDNTTNMSEGQDAQEGQEGPEVDNKKNKKKKRRASSISRHSRGANSKSIRPGAQKSTFPPASFTSNNVQTVQHTPKVEAQQQHRRDVHLLQMKLRYEQKKNAGTSQTVQQLTDGIQNLKEERDNIILMHKRNNNNLSQFNNQLKRTTKF
ncbi:hypothetical protein HJC23_012243 [Cyclotella cryptica]|uniref:Uncharacterized protein n=1 Tax=Cyclotella cryptica TaxID=29204 RepID=A0ABD3PN33_9STRA